MSGAAPAWFPTGSLKPDPTALREMTMIGLEW
jgi:hypothetical protein